MKKILIISSFIPYPYNAGGHIGVFEMINHFREKYDLSLVVPCINKEDISSYKELKALWPDVNIYIFQKTFLQRITNSFFYKLQKIFYLAFKKRYFRDSIWHHDKSGIVENIFNYTEHISDRLFANYVNDIIQSDQFDLVQVEFYGNISLPVFLKQTCPVAFIHHELRFVKSEREVATIAPDDKFLKGMLAQLKSYEIEMLKNYNRIVLMSEIDKNILSPYLPENLLYVSPSGIKIRGKNTGTENYVFNNILTFLGGENHYPNIDGLVWFMENCFSLLLQQHPSIKLHIIGKWGHEFISKYESEKIRFLGFVENLDEALLNSIMIVPVRIGSGIRMKIIDGINAGIPFVTTTIGVEGWDFRNNMDCFIADTPEEYVRCLSQLITDKQMQNLFIRNSQIRLKELYSFDKAMEKRQKLYDSIFLKNS